MKTKEQQELCKLIEEFNENKNGDTFGQILNELFHVPLLFPVGKDDKRGKFLLAEQGEMKYFSGFSDMEEAARQEIGDIDFVAYTIEEYSKVIEKAEDVKGLIINLFNENNCVINREFFMDVVCPAFEEHRIMPGLRDEKTGEYIAITKMPFAVGRNKNADLTIEDNGINDIHALIVERDYEYYVVDKDSLNGVYVNGKQVEKGGEMKIEFDDIIEFSDIEYAYVPMGIADKQTVTPSIYGDDREMIANGMYVMQNTVLVQEYLKNEEKFVPAMESESQKENFRKFFIIALDAVCGAKEQQQNITDQSVIEEQRKTMIGKGLTIFDRDDYGFSKKESEDCEIHIAQFPAYLHIPELAKRIYFVQKKDGERLIVKVQVTRDKPQLIKVSNDEQVTQLGVAPETMDEELRKVIEIANA